MAVTKDKPAPYAPASAVLDIVGRYRNRGLVFPVTAEVLGRIGISDSLISRTLQALQTLDLINDVGNPTGTLEGIRLAPEAEYKKRLEDWLKGAYADVFAFVDPSTDEEVRIRDAFRSYQPVGQQNRMVTLFQGLCAAAGLIPDKAAPSPRARAPARASGNAPQSGLSFIKTAKKLAAQPTSTVISRPQGLPPALSGLLESLPDPSQGWYQKTRDRFLTTFQAVLDFCIPIRDLPANDEGDDPD